MGGSTFLALAVGQAYSYCVYTDFSLVVTGRTCGNKDLNVELVQRFFCLLARLCGFVWTVHADPSKATAFGRLPQSKTELSLTLFVIFSMFIFFIPDLIEVIVSANNCECQKK